MMEIGKEYDLEEKQLQELFVLGFNHDIGYEFGDHANHGQIGGNILKNMGYPYWQEIYYHGAVDPEYQSLYLWILNKADMMIDSRGNDVGFEKRLEDIKNRYGEKSSVYQNAKELVNKLKEG